MKNKKLRVLSIVLCALMLLSLFIGCSGNPESKTASATTTATAAATPTTEPAKAATPDISKKVEVVMYLAGDAQPDSALVNEELNKITQEKLNCTLKIVNIPWGDWDTKYPLILTAGEPYDLIYTSNWAGFRDYSQKGAFMAIDDLLPVYAPNIMKQTTDIGWKAVTVKGKIVGIPAYLNDFVTDAIAIRGDLRKKYGLPEVVDLDTLEAYMDAVRKNEPDIIPFNVSSKNDRNLFQAATNYDYVVLTNVGQGQDIFTDSYQTANDVQYLSNIPGFDDYAKRMKRWSDNGYIPKDVFTNTVGSMEYFKNGKSAVAVGNTGQISGDVIFQSIQTHPEWESEFVSLRIKTGVGIHPMGWMSDGMAVGANSKNPERALMVLDLLRSDRTSYDLLHYGILNRNYVLLPDGSYKAPDGVVADKNGYPANNEGQWGITNADFERPNTQTWKPWLDTYKPIFEKMATPDIMANFPLVSENVATEIAAVAQVETQYLIPILWGKVKNVDESLVNLRKKMQEAGADKITAEVKTQVKAYIDSLK